MVDKNSITDSFKLKAYLYSTIALILLNSLILLLLVPLENFFSSTRANLLSFLGWAIFQIITVLIILYFGFRNPRDLKKRVLISSVVIYLGSFFALALYLTFLSYGREGFSGVFVFGIALGFGVYFIVIANAISSFIEKYMQKE